MQTILFAGNLTPVKGVDRLFHAMVELPEAQLLVVGDGELRKALTALAAKLGIAGRVQFLGRKPHAEIADFMHAADVLCLPSHSEGMPNVVLEALACGTPVVATAVGEIPFIIREDVNGALVEGKTEGEIRTALAEALRRVLRKPWNPEAIAATVKEFTWEKAAQTIVDAIAAQSRPQESGPGAGPD